MGFYHILDFLFYKLKKRKLDLLFEDQLLDSVIGKKTYVTIHVCIRKVFKWTLIFIVHDRIYSIPLKIS